MVAQNGVGYPNMHYIVYNGDALVYTNLACGATTFANVLAFDGSQNQPNSTGSTSYTYDTRTNTFAELPYANSSYICVDGVGASCTQEGDRSPTLQKETPASNPE